MHDLLSGWMEAKSSHDNFKFVMPTQMTDRGIRAVDPNRSWFGFLQSLLASWALDDS